MATGTVIRLNKDRGFGFIRNANGEDFFFHRSACVDCDFNDLKERQMVTFEPSEGEKGLRAECVELARDSGRR